jgi:hypothetical protein
MFDNEEIIKDNHKNYNGGEDNKVKKKPEYPVIRAIVTCEYNGKEINLEYISRGTHIATAIHAVAVNMGFQKYISNINVDVKWLGEDMKSLVSAIVKIGCDREKIASGEWVSSDLLHTIIQATISAGRKWIYQEFRNRLSIVEYESIVRETARIRIKFYENRLIFDRYDFENKKDSINQFKKINDLTKEWISKLEQYPDKDIQNNFSDNFYRIYILSKLYMLHYYNVQVDHKECHRLIQEIDIEFYSDRVKYDKILVPAKIGLAVEKIAYNISFGTPYQGNSPLKDTIDILLVDDLLTREDILKDLGEIDSKIKTDLKKSIDKTSDPGYDIHYSLGSYYLTTSRLLFYVGKNKEEFDSAFNRSIQAAYYFQRIGLSRKMQRSIILAGRISARVETDQSKEQAKKCKVLSESLLEQSIIDLNLPKNDTELGLSLKSRLNLLKGEYKKATTVDKQEIFICYLKSLRGSLWLGLNRHLADTLYIVSKHIKGLSNLEIDAGIKEVFPELFIEELKEDEDKNLTKFSPDQIDFFTMDLTRNAKKNKMAENIVRQLLRLYDPSIEAPTNTDIAKVLNDLSCEMWNTWHHNSTRDIESSHPFVDKIKHDTFLNEV